MFKIFKFLFYLIGIAVIAGSVYVATLPSKFDHEFKATFNKIPRAVLVNKLINFNSWKNWAIEDTLLFKVGNSKDPLQRRLESSLLQKQEFRLENEQISDSIIVQKLYTKNEKAVQTLTWNLGNFRSVDNLKLKIDEQLSFSDRLYNLLGWENKKRAWLLGIGKKLSVLGSTIEEHAHDYTVSSVQKSWFGNIHYVYITASGSLNHLERQTQQHIRQLEQFLGQLHIPIVGSPFTILNNQLENGDLIFSTALPINNAIEVDNNGSIRYGFIEKVPALFTTINGNPQNMVNLWENFEKTKEVVFENMGTKKYIVYKNLGLNGNILQKKQQLVWEILESKPDEAVQKQEIDNSINSIQSI